MAAVELRDTPGASFEYTNTGYNTLGMIVEAVSGQWFADYLDEHVFRPLQLQDTHATASQALGDGGARGYYRWFRATYVPEAIATPAGLQSSATLFSSAQDLAQVVVMNLQLGQYEGATVLSAARGRDAEFGPHHRRRIGVLRNGVVEPAATGVVGRPG